MKLSASANRRFAEHALYCMQNEPGLKLDIDVDGGHASINGTIRVPVGGGRTQDFPIEIRYVGLSPFKLPSTRDPAGRFPPDVERHVMPDGGFCMWIPQTAPTDFDALDGLALHLDRVREFILLQLMYEDRLRRGRTPAWPGPAWGHGDEGHREWVRAQASGLTAQAVAGLVGAAISRRHPGSRCPCGSGRSFGQCHVGWVADMRRALRISGAVYEELKAIVEKTPPDQSPKENTKQLGIDFAWKVHGAQESWTAKVDAKAAILFTVELVLLAALIAAHGHDKLIGRMHHGPRLIAETGTVLAFISSFLAGGAVIPRLGRTSQHKTQRYDHLIYFGHLRHWAPKELQDQLQALTSCDELEQLSRQLVEMSQRNWIKHRWLQAAMILALFSVILVAISVFMSTSI